MLAAKHRLGRSDALSRVIKKGRVARVRGFSLKSIKTNLPESRFAVSISQKANKRATARNRVRRQIVGMLMDPKRIHVSGFDCAIAVYKEAFDMSRAERAEELQKLFFKAKIFRS